MQTTSQELVYSFEVLNSSNNPLPSIQHHRTTYIIGNPGEDFHLRARVSFLNPSSLARPNKPQFKVFAKVDGQSVGYTKLCYAADNISGVEDGLSESVFFRGRGYGDGRKCLFTFLKPESKQRNEPGTRVLPAGESEMGTILVRFREIEGYSLVLEGGEEERTRGGERDCASLGSEALVVEEGDMKHYMKPSLRAGGGQIVHSFAPRVCAYGKEAGRRHYHTVDLQCRFETADVLRLRGILKLDNLAHKVIYDAAQAKERVPQLASKLLNPHPTPKTPLQTHFANGEQSFGRPSASTSSEASGMGRVRQEMPEGVSAEARMDPLLVDNLDVESPSGEATARGGGPVQAHLNGIRSGLDLGRRGYATTEPVHLPPATATGRPDGVNALTQAQIPSEHGQEAPVHSTWRPSLDEHTAHALSQTAPALGTSPAHQLENGLCPLADTPERESSSREPPREPEFDEYMAQIFSPVVNRTRGALAAAHREGRTPLSLSSLKRKAAERDGIYVEKRKKSVFTKEKVTIDLTAKSGGAHEDGREYVAMVERLPKPRVVPLD